MNRSFSTAALVATALTVACSTPDARVAGGTRLGDDEPTMAGSGGASADAGDHPAAPVIEAPDGASVPLAEDAGPAPGRDAAATSDAGAATTPPGTAPDAKDAAAPSPTKRVLVVGGERGLRLVSTDLGLTWASTGTVDNPAATEIQGATWGAGKFVAVGSRFVFVSADGRTWKAVPHALGWLQAVAYGNGRFVAVGGNYLAAWSTDGETWQKGTDVGPNPSRSDYNVNTILFDGSDFYATGVDGGQIPNTNPERWNYRVYKTKDAAAWSYVTSVVSGGPSTPSIVVCAGAVKPWIDCAPTPFGVDGVWFRFDYPGKLMRSTDGKTFTPIGMWADGLRAFAASPP